MKPEFRILWFEGKLTEKIATVIRRKHELHGNYLSGSANVQRTYVGRKVLGRRVKDKAY